MLDGLRGQERADLAGPVGVFIRGEGDDEAASIVVPPEDRFCLLESALSDEFVAG